MAPRLDDAIAREAVALAAAGTSADDAAVTLVAAATGSPYLLRSARESVLDQLEIARDNAVLLVTAVRLLNAAIEAAKAASSGGSTETA